MNTMYSKFTMFDAITDGVEFDTDMLDLRVGNVVLS